MAKNRYPNLGKLGVAILESIVKNWIGEDAIKILKKPVEEKDTQTALGDALSRTDTRFQNEFTDSDITFALIDLPLANLPSLQNAVQDFYEKPTSSLLHDVIKTQLISDYPRFKKSQVEKATRIYLDILREELVSVSDEIRQKLISLAILGIKKSLEKITEGDKLFERFLKPSNLSQNIKTRYFQTLVNERTRNFVGREYLFSAIDKLITSETFTSGYILLHGEPGIGKTSLIAQLIKTHGYIHHFNIASQNIRSTSDFLGSVCSQLILRFDLPYEILPDDARKDSGFLSELLSVISEGRQDQPTIVLVDAIDEADDVGLPSNTNRLHLPSELPERIYFIVTAREQANYHLLVDNREDLYIKDSDPANMKDIQKFINKFIEEHQKEMLGRISTWKISQTDFIDIIAEKSQGNFMYLVHVLRDIKDKRILSANLDDPRKLPKGLRQYYQRHWQSMQENATFFDKYEKPIICILATVRESVSVEQLLEWTQQSELEIKRTVNKWREFLNADTDDNEELIYRIYHSSFQDFLREEVGLKPYHELIARSALNKIKQ